MQEAVVVALAAAVDEGSAGLSPAVEVPAHRVSPTAALLQRQQARVCSTRQEEQTGMRRHTRRGRASEIKTAL